MLFNCKLWSGIVSIYSVGHMDMNKKRGSTDVIYVIERWRFDKWLQFWSSSADHRTCTDVYPTTVHWKILAGSCENFKSVKNPREGVLWGISLSLLPFFLLGFLPCNRKALVLWVSSLQVLEVFWVLLLYWIGFCCFYWSFFFLSFFWIWWFLFGVFSSSCWVEFPFWVLMGFLIYGRRREVEG